MMKSPVFLCKGNAYLDLANKGRYRYLAAAAAAYLNLELRKRLEKQVYI
jgi:hypothetical protein